MGDFFGDKHDDIVLVDAKGKLVLLDNTDGKFTRVSPIIVSENGGAESIHGYIQQLEAFDMDADGKTDIVTFDDSGEINILYGTVRDVNGKKERMFTKKLIESGLGMRLSKEIRNDGGAFSFSGLLYPDQGTEPSGKIVNPENATGAINQGMIDNIIYYQYAYQSGNDDRSPEDKKDTAISSSAGANMKRNPDGTYAKDALGNPIDDAGSMSYDVMAGSSLTGSIDYTKGSSNSGLTSEISGLVETARSAAGSGNADFGALDNSSRGTKRIFIRSSFAEGKGLQVEKTYTLTSGGDIMQTNAKVRVEISLKNTSNKAFKDAVYLDSNDAKLFQGEQNGIYNLSRSGAAEEELPLKYLVEGDFDYGFDLGRIAPGETVKIRYLVTATPAAFGKMSVGLLEKGEAGDDIYGDISLSPNNICGGELIMWRSVPPFPRSYEKGKKKFRDNSELPEELRKNSIDLDKNGVPDYIDELVKSGKSDDTSLLQKYSQAELDKYNIDSNKNGVPDRGDSKGSQVVAYNPNRGSIEIGGLSSGNVEAINGQIDELVRGLGCGFGGGACLSMPMNWAPLAPGTTPSIMGFPLATLGTDTGFPIFSVLTGMPVGPLCIPSVWPLSPLDLAKYCTDLGAGGYLGDKAASNFFRLYITPTITGAVGVAACFNSLPSVTGKIPPQGVSPLVPGGNCVVAAKPLMGCKDDGSDGDAGSLGLGMDSNNSFVNANACVKPSGNTILLPEDRKNLLSYVRGDNAHLPEINASMAR